MHPGTLSILILVLSTYTSPCFGLSCRQHLHYIGYNDTAFELCAILHARPFTVCITCHLEYSRAFTLFYNLFHSRDEISKNCSEELISGARVSIIQRDYDHMTKTWSISNCDNCFDVTDKDNVITYNKSQKTINFENKEADLKDCVDENKGNTTSLCDICSKKFDDLSDYFNGLAEDTDGMVCMDIIDKMNITRNAWAGYGCTHTYNMSIEVFATLGCVILFSIMFYVVARWSQRPKDIALIRVNTLQNAMFDDMSVEKQEEHVVSKSVDYSDSVPRLTC